VQDKLEDQCDGLEKWAKNLLNMGSIDFIPYKSLDEMEEEREEDEGPDAN
jgi:hypothetical protein